MRRLFLALLLIGCRERSQATPLVVDAASAAVPASATVVVDSGPPGLPPLEGEWIEKLALPDGGVGYVTPPVGAREPRPVIVAVHGAWDDPGLTCSAWRLIVDVHAFVVCPGGRPVDPSREGRLFVWSSGEHIAKRVHDAIDATKAKYPGRIREDAPMIYVAFSQGSNLAGTLLSREAKAFPRVVFTEGGYRTFEDASIARAFAKGGGERVLMTCSQPGCAGSFAGSRAALERAGVTARVDYSGPHGHSMPPAVRERIHDAMPWIVAGLAGWETYASAPKLPGH